MLSAGDIHRLYLGHFTAPEDDPRAGQKIFVCAYLTEHPDGPILLDTGIGSGHEETERLYHPVRRPLEDIRVLGLDPLAPGQASSWSSRVTRRDTINYSAACTSKTSLSPPSTS